MTEKTVPSSIKAMLEGTYNSAVLSKVGDYAGIYKFSSYELVSSTDGVGTKILIPCNHSNDLSREERDNFHEVIGEDLFNHCVNDILVVGAEPLFFLNTFSYTDDVAEHCMPPVMRGMTKAAQQVMVPVISGETAKLNGFYPPGVYDLSGTIVGYIGYPSRKMPKETICAGDVLLGLKSSGPHTNGYTRIQNIFCAAKAEAPHKHAWLGVPYTGNLHPHWSVLAKLGMSVREACMQPHRCYFDLVFPMLNRFNIKAVAHITGKGIHGNLRRVLKGKAYTYNHPRESWPELFKIIQDHGYISLEEMVEEFNLGIGMVLVVGEDEADVVRSYLTTKGESFYEVGEVR